MAGAGVGRAPGAVCRVLAAVAAVLPLLLPLLVAPAAAAATPPSAVAAPVPPAQEAEGVVLTLRSVGPAVAGPGQAVTIAGTVHNTGRAALRPPLVTVVLGRQELARRESVTAWATATGPAQGRVVGRTQLRTPVAPGASADFVVRVDRAARLRQATYGALPLSVQTGRTSLRTFAGYQRLKQYQPLGLAWAVPLTLDPDPALFGAEGQARDEAWTAALGSDSRLERILDATEDLPVTWALDPTLLPSLLGGAESLSSGRASVERIVRGRTEARIRDAASRHSPWVLPDTDGDVAAVAQHDGGASVMAALVRRAAPVARALGGRADIAWPADGLQSPPEERALRRLFAGPGLAGQVAAQSALPAGLGTATTPGSARRSAGGLPVLAYDDQLSALFAQTTSPAAGVLSAQRFIAESAALLDELPGIAARTVLVAAPRAFNPAPEAAAAFFGTVRAIPWLEQQSTDDQLRAAAQAEPMPTGTPGRTSSPPTGPAQPVLTPARAAALERNVHTVRGVALIRDDGDAFARTWSRAAEQLASVRWRSALPAWLTLNGRMQAATQESTTAVEVSARTINFLAETGRLQITVTNDLDVAVENVKLTLEPANGRLRVESPPALLRIGANSRATVNVEVTALAAGAVPIRTTLTTPDGTVIGQGADVQVQVTPTGNWIYWVLGGLGGLILVLGIWRSVRRPRRTTPLRAGIA